MPDDARDYTWDEWKNKDIPKPPLRDIQGTQGAFRFGGNLFRRLTRIPVPGGAFIPIPTGRRGAVQGAAMEDEFVQDQFPIPLRRPEPRDFGPGYSEAEERLFSDAPVEDIPVEDIAEAQDATAPPATLAPPSTGNWMTQTLSDWSSARERIDKRRGTRAPPSEPGELPPPDSSFYRTRLRFWTNKGLSSNDADNEARADFMNRERGTDSYTATQFQRQKDAIEDRGQRSKDRADRDKAIVQSRDDKEKQQIIDFVSSTGRTILMELEADAIHTMQQRDPSTRAKFSDAFGGQVAYDAEVRRASQSKLDNAYKAWVKATKGKPESQWYYKDPDDPEAEGSPIGVGAPLSRYAQLRQYFRYRRRGEDLGMHDEMPTLFNIMSAAPQMRPRP
jgi:hypothetical protein